MKPWTPCSEKSRNSRSIIGSVISPFQTKNGSVLNSAGGLGNKVFKRTRESTVSGDARDAKNKPRTSVFLIGISSSYAETAMLSDTKVPAPQVCGCEAVDSAGVPLFNRSRDGSPEGNAKEHRSRRWLVRLNGFPEPHQISIVMLDIGAFGQHHRNMPECLAEFADPIRVPRVGRRRLKAQQFHFAVVVRVVIRRDLDSILAQWPSANPPQNGRRTVPCGRGAQRQRSPHKLRKSIHSQQHS